jgi:hypothetical protein
MNIDVGAIVSLFGALVSVGAAYGINRSQVRLALFEKRARVYDAVCGFLAEVGTTGRPHEWQQIHTLLRETRDAEFLFPKAVPELISALIPEATEYRAHYAHWESQPKGTTECAEAFEKQKKSEGQLNNRWPSVKKEFHKHLKLERDWWQVV